MSIKVLQICASLNECGGVQTVIRNYYAHMNQTEFVFDFIVMDPEEGGLEPWFEQRGSSIYHVTPRRIDFKKNTLEIKNIMQSGNYDVVHCHQDYRSLIAVMLAKYSKISKIVVHSHTAIPTLSIPNRVAKYLSVLVMKQVADVLIGCGKNAAKWLYGKKMLQKGKVVVLNNAIDIQRYAFSLKKRADIRKKLKIGDKLVLGNVARFSAEKNHRLLMDIFAEFHFKHPESVLLLVGDGELKGETEVYCKKIGLSEEVLFLGTRSDVPDLLSAMDVFVLPSRFEGLALIMIEAQANGVPAVCSPYVTRELGIHDNVLYVPEGCYENIDDWCKTIENALEIGRLQNTAALTKAGFNICEEAKKLERIYNGRIDT